MGRIVINEINLGGLAYSRFAGAPNSVAAMIGLDIHSSPGMVKVNQALKKDSGTTITGFCKVAINCSDGNSYWFDSASGNIWKDNNAGTYTLVHTTVPTTGGAGCLGAIEYLGFVYWATANYLHRIPIVTGVDTNWAGAVDNWQVFTNTDTAFHPMYILNLVLYIGDASYVSQVDGSAGGAHVFSAKALNLGKPYRASCFSYIQTDLLVGTYINSSITDTRIFRWNTWSVNFSASDPIPEVGINAMWRSNNLVLANCGVNGNLYIYTRPSLFEGQQLMPFKRIPGTWGSGQNAIVNANSAVNFNGLPLFGLSAQAGTPAPTVIYSFGRHSNDFPMVMNAEYVISTGNTSNVKIGAMLVSGINLKVAWEDDNGGTTYGVDIIDWNNKYTAGYFDTRVMGLADREWSKVFSNFIADYDSLPAGTGFTLSVKINGGAWTTIPSAQGKIDTKRNYKRYQYGQKCNTMEVRVAFVTSGNSGPTLTDLIIFTGQLGSDDAGIENQKMATAAQARTGATQ